ncbi:hypothetical protein A4U53_025690 [Rhizobium ruizarguesonis]
MKIIDIRKKVKFVACERPEFGQIGWRRTENYSDSSGRLGGGHDQPWWCNQVAASFISSRSIGPQNTWETVTSHEESDKDWKGKVTYKYHCTIKVSWEPSYNRREDPICGTYEQ